MVEVRFTGNPAEIRAEMAQLLGNVASSPSLPAPSHTGKADSGEKKAAPAKAAEPVPTATPVKTAEAAPSADDIKALVVKLIGKLGKEGFVKFFADNFAPHKKVGELSAEQQAVFVAKATELLK